MADITIDQLATQTFYQIPEIFFTRIQHNDKGYVKLTSSYVGLSSDAKLAYGALYNRCKLSISSFQKGNRDYVDENGSVFLIFTVADLMLLLDKGKMKVTQIKKELQEHGLLREVRQGLNKPNRLYLQLVDANLEVAEHYSDEGELLMKLNAFGRVIYQKEDCSPKTPQTLDNSGSPFFGRPKSGRQEVHKTDAIKTENSKIYYNDTNRYEDDSSLSNLSDSEAFQMGQHGFLSDKTIQLLSLFGVEAKLLENKIYQAKRQVEKDYNHLLPNNEQLYGELWTSDLEREIEKLIFKVKTGEHEGKTIKNIPGYFYKMMVHFWQMALLIEKEHGFIAVSKQSEHIKQYPEEYPSLISYYYPNKLSEKQLTQSLSRLVKGQEVI
ncbi:replication initiator protein A [Streptococcus pneumoniae]|nr:replication initiator protein A [Streptococcus pneumoniae]